MRLADKLICIGHAYLFQHPFRFIHFVRAEDRAIRSSYSVEKNSARMHPARCQNDHGCKTAEGATELRWLSLLPSVSSFGRDAARVPNGVADRADRLDPVADRLDPVPRLCSWPARQTTSSKN